VKSEKNAVNLAYTPTKLGLHTDLPYYAYPPGTQMLHCIKQYDVEEKAGRSLVVDGFQVAEQLRRDHPGDFNILHEVPVEFYDIGKDFTEFHKVHHSPTFVYVNKYSTKAVDRTVNSGQYLYDRSFMTMILDLVRARTESLGLSTVTSN
jgi:gamma-butyrobetaine dioxygenase